MLFKLDALSKIFEQFLKTEFLNVSEKELYYIKIMFRFVTFIRKQNKMLHFYLSKINIIIVSEYA